MRSPPRRSTRQLSTIVTVTGPGRVKCGLCKRELDAAYQSGIPGPCGCDWLWYGSVLAAFPNRAAGLERILARNRRLAALGDLNHTRRSK